MIHIICGPPGAGKSTYVSRYKTHRDIVFDFDTLWVAITGCDMYDKPDHMFVLMMKIRRAIIETIVNERIDYHAWIIATAAKAKDRQVLQDITGGDVTVIETGANTCHRNISNDPARSSKHEMWRPIIDRWWDTYEPRPTDTKITEDMLREMIITPKRRRAG